MFSSILVIIIQFHVIPSQQAMSFCTATASTHLINHDTRLTDTSTTLIPPSHQYLRIE